jgi:hypothetical protein
MSDACVWWVRSDCCIFKAVYRQLSIFVTHTHSSELQRTVYCRSLISSLLAVRHNLTSAWVEHDKLLVGGLTWQLLKKDKERKKKLKANLHRNSEPSIITLAGRDDVPTSGVASSELFIHHHCSLCPIQNARARVLFLCAHQTPLTFIWRGTCLHIKPLLYWYGLEGACKSNPS